jgi:hypothetical protein
MLLKKYIKNFLLEANVSNGVHPNIVKMCNFLIDIDKNARGIVEDSGSNVVVSYSEEVPKRELEEDEYDDSGLFDELKNSVHFSLEEEQHASSAPYPITPSGKRVWTVTSADSFKGLGPLLYDVGIEYISSTKNGSVMSDRKFVFKFAKPVWDFYVKRGDLEIEQMDFDIHVDDYIVNDYDDDWVSLFYKDGDKEEGVQANKVTPGYDNDDVDMDVIFYDKKNKSKEEWEKSVENWTKSPLSKAFFKSRTATIDFLKSLNIIIFKK